MTKTDIQSVQPARRLTLSPTHLVTLSLFFIALPVRVIGLKWGLPNAGRWYSYHPDERQIVQAVASLDFLGGQFNPHFFNYPSLYFYLVHLAYLAANFCGLAHAAIPGAPAQWPIIRDIILCGRLVTALLGAATVPLVYGIAKEIGGRKIGVFAALLLAFLPGHVQHSHFATVDVPATFFVALCLAFSVQRSAFSDGAARRDLLLAAFIAGLAAATKYNAGLVFVAPLCALFLRHGDKSPFSRSALLPFIFSMFGAAALGFLLGCPFSALAFREFWGDAGANGFYYEAFVHPKIGSGDIFKNTGNGWWFHLTFNLPFVMTWPLLIASLLGMGAFFSPRRRVTPSPCHLVCLIWTALFFFSLGLSQVRFMRYVLPLAPALCVFAALGAAWLGDLIRVRRGFAIIATLSGLVAVIGASNVLFPFISIDPRDQAAAFLNQQTASRLQPVTIGLINPPWFWTPPFSPQDAPPRSRFVVNGSPDGRYRFVVTDFDVAKLQHANPKWIVVSEFEWRDQERLNDAAVMAYQKFVWSHYKLWFGDEYGSDSDGVRNVPPLELPGRAFVPHDFLYTNPQVCVYGPAP